MGFKKFYKTYLNAPLLLTTTKQPKSSDFQTLQTQHHHDKTPTKFTTYRESKHLQVEGHKIHSNN
jgi:hypothetical protein